MPWAKREERIMRHWIPALVALGWAVLVAVSAGPARAQDGASTYRVGEHVSVKPTSWQDVWEEGVVESVTSDQVIVHSPSAWRAFVLSDVRHLSASSPGGTGGGQAGVAPRRSYATASPGGTAGQAAGSGTSGNAGAAQVAAAGGGRNGERVSVAVGGSCCYDGTIVGTGSGAAAGMYLIHYDNPASHDAYAQPHFIFPFGTETPGRRRTARAAAPAA
jgi:hypothetical protein